MKWKAQERKNKQEKDNKNKFEEHTVKCHSGRRNKKCLDYYVLLPSEGLLQQNTPIKHDSIELDNNKS